jgi:hypothetical protein
VIEEEPLCPECGYPLTGIKVLKDKRGKITIEFFCDEAGEDRFSFQIATGLTDKDIGRLKEKGKAIPKQMAVRLLERKSEEQAIKDIDKRIATRKQAQNKTG